MTDKNSEKPDEAASKIIIDEDWKAEAQAEKERLTEEAAAAPAPADAPAPAESAAPTGPEGDPNAPREIPPASFLVLINSLAMQILMVMGGMEDPETKKRFVDLELAKHHIDTLAILQEKTKGNLTDEEDKLLERALYELRMNFVQISQLAQKATPEKE